MQIHFSNIQTKIEHDAVVLLIAEDKALTASAIRIDDLHNGIIKSILNDENFFKNKFGTSKSITVTEQGKIKNIILFSIGEDKNLNPQKFIELGGKIVNKLAMLKIKKASILLEDNLKALSKEEIASLIGEGAMLSSYRFDKYFTKKKPEEKFSLESIDIELDAYSKAKELFANSEAIVSGVFLARNCVSEPANKLYPESYAKIIVDNLTTVGVSVEVFGEEQMRKMGMGALLGVGQGSAKESKLVVMQYNGGKAGEAPLAFVGKGVTFDTGGISLKPAGGMEDMKYDMGGSAAVVGLMKTLASRKAKVNVVGVVGLVENMPDGDAQRPSDVVTTMSGQTVEILNTDAEGRLVLADALWYTQDKFKPKFMINLATLTGAIVVALGNSFAGCFSNNDELSSRLEKSGSKIDEKIWRMPLHQDFDDMINSGIADVANIGCVRGAAGSSTAAQFLQRFVNDFPWAHLDIAGMAWEKTSKKAITPKGATGFGVRLLNQLIQDYYESN